MRTILIVFVLVSSGCHAQSTQDTAISGPDSKRLPWVLAGSGLVIGGTLYSLNTAWYQGYQRSSFHFFDDGSEWLQMDKVGHVYATYTTGRWGYGLLKWGGANERTALWLGGTLGFTYLTGVELLDSQFEEWGFSWWDMAANAAGTALFIAQHIAWEEQRMTLKYSAHLTAYAEQRPDLLGQGLSQRLLKDYNGQTYWLSISPGSFSSGQGGLPEWLCVAVGYGAESMTGARNNDRFAEGTVRADPRYRQFYLSLDVDLSRIRTRSKVLKSLFSVLNAVKIPAPTIELGSNGKWRLHPLYF